MSNEKFPIGSLATINSPCHRLHNSLGRVIKVSDPQREKDGYIALHLFTGERAYDAICLLPEKAKPAPKTCYMCSFAISMNDRDVRICSARNGEVNASFHFCEKFTQRKVGCGEL